MRAHSGSVTSVPWGLGYNVGLFNLFEVSAVVMIPNSLDEYVLCGGREALESTRAGFEPQLCHLLSWAIITLL